MQHFTLSDEQWTRLSSILPKYQSSSKGGRPRLELKKVFEGIIFIRANKLPWKSTPKEFGSKTALNDYFRQWKEGGVFDKLRAENVFTLTELIQFHLADLISDSSCQSEGNK